MMEIPDGRRLLLGPVATETLGQDLVFGPWCLSADERLLARWRDFGFPDPFPTPDLWVAADRNCRLLANHLVTPWALRLNSSLGVEHSHGFWRVMLMNWLTVAIPALWYRWRYTEDFIARHGDEPLRVSVVPDLPDWEIPDSGDTIYRLISPAGDALITSALIRHLAPPHWSIVEDTPLPGWQVGTASQAPGLRESRLGRLVRAVFGRLPVQTVPDTKWERLLLGLLALAFPRRPGTVRYQADDGVLSRFPPAFLSWLDGFLPRLLPRTLRDGFPALETAVAAGAFVPGRLLVDQINTPRDDRRVMIAAAHERGERLVCSQHGGIYGTAQAMMAAAETEYPYHAFITWGWREQEDCRGNFIPLPSPALSRLRDRHGEREQKLLLVGGSMNIRGTRLGWMPSPHGYLEYREAKARFLGGLRAEVMEHAHYRPYQRGYSDIADGDYVQANFPGLPIQQGDLQEAMLRCRLVVVDHPVTTMLIALVANVPTVLTWTPAQWPMARQARPLVERLRAVRILHSTPEAAAAHVNDVWKDVPAWWMDAQVQEARRAFIHRYALSGRHWLWSWARGLYRIAKS